MTGAYPAWDNGRIEGVVEDYILYGWWSEAPSYAPHNDAGQIVFALHEDGNGFTGWWRYGNSGYWDIWSGNRSQIITSAWAFTEVEIADAHGLVPDALRDVDLAIAMTRAEFCSLAVTLYEKVTGTEITGRVKFTDTSDANVEKAAYIGVVNGVGDNRFDPDGSLTREQAATILARLAESVDKPLDVMMK